MTLDHETIQEMAIALWAQVHGRSNKTKSQRWNNRSEFCCQNGGIQLGWCRLARSVMTGVLESLALKLPSGPRMPFHAGPSGARPCKNKVGRKVCNHYPKYPGQPCESCGQI